MSNYVVKCAGERFDVTADFVKFDDRNEMNFFDGENLMASFRTWDYFFEILKNEEDNGVEHV